jgi:hypothetical protein
MEHARENRPIDWLVCNGNSSIHPSLCGPDQNRVIRRHQIHPFQPKAWHNFQSDSEF